MTDFEKVKIIRKALKKNQADFAALFGIKQNTYSLYETGARDLPKNLVRLLKAEHGLNPEWWENGSEPMFITNEMTNISNGKQILGIQKDNCYIVPVKAFGGFLLGYESKVYMDSIQKMSFPLIRGECYLFEIEGYSMVKPGDPEGSYYPGNWVMTTPINNFDELRSHKVYVFQTIDGIIIKEYNKMESDCAHLTAYSGEPVTPIHLKSIKRVYFVDYKLNKP